MVLIITLYITSLADFILAYRYALIGDLPQVVLSMVGGFYLALAATMKLM